MDPKWMKMDWSANENLYAALETCRFYVTCHSPIRVCLIVSTDSRKNTVYSFLCTPLLRLPAQGGVRGMETEQNFVCSEVRVTTQECRKTTL